MDLKIMILVAILIAVIVYIIGSFILGKKIKLKDLTCIKEFILTILPNVINVTEDLDGSDYKKETAISTCLSLAQDKFGTFKESDLKKLVAFTSEKLEAILTTPTKKNKED